MPGPWHLPPPRITSDEPRKENSRAAPGARGWHARLVAFLAHAIQRDPFMAHLELENLTRHYQGAISVDGIDLAVEHGEFICLLGPSGGGKTTTLRMIAGFLEPDAGEIRVNGKALSSPKSVIPPERRNMGMIFQSYAVWPHMTVRQNVAYGLKMKGAKPDEQRARTDAVLQATTPA